MRNTTPLIRAAVRLGWAHMRETLRPSLETGPMIAICHCHHPDLVPELAWALRRLPAGATLHVTSSRSDVFERWNGLRRRPAVETVFHDVENRGRDLRPFFEVAGKLSVAPETLVLKIHGKKSSYSARGERWRRDLLAGLLPGRSALGRVAARFREDPRLGLLGAPRSFISHPVYWGQNRNNVERLMAGMCGVTPEERDLGFFAGSMFWLRGALLLDLLPHIDLGAFEPEPLPQDGTYAHAIERVIPMAARRMGWRMGEIGSDAVLDPDAVRQRKVAYL